MSLCKSVCRLSSQLLYLLSCKVKRKSGFYFCAIIEEVVSSYLNNLDKINHTSIVNIAQRIRLWRSGRGSRWPLIKNAPERWIRRLLTCISKTKGGGEGLSMQNSYYSGNIKNSVHSLSENISLPVYEIFSQIYFETLKNLKHAYRNIYKDCIASWMVSHWTHPCNQHSYQDIKGHLPSKHDHPKVSSIQISNTKY